MATWAQLNLLGERSGDGTVAFCNICTSPTRELIFFVFLEHSLGYSLSIWGDEELTPGYSFAIFLHLGVIVGVNAMIFSQRRPSRAVVGLLNGQVQKNSLICGSYSVAKQGG